jgi:dihydroflavonol-4-reductase
MTALVTGASGFLGSAIVRILLEQGLAVAVLVRPDSDSRNFRDLDVVVHHGDLRDRQSLESAMNGCQFVFHAAADYRLWARRPQDMYDSNVNGSRNIVEAAAAAGIERLVYTSSVAVLGINADRSPSNEDTPVTVDDMIGHYKRSKYLAEEAVHETAGRLGLSYVVTNPSTPVGPRDVKPTPTGRIIVDAATGKIPAFVDTGLNVVHVDDVAHGHWLALQHGEDGERYILGGEDLSLREILGIVAQHVGRQPPRLRLPRAPLYPVALAAEVIARVTGRQPQVTVDGLRMAAKHMYFSSEKAIAKLGYSARPADQAIIDALEWFRAHSYI